MKILIKALTVLIWPKISQDYLIDQLIQKHQKPTLKIQTLSEMKCSGTLRTDSRETLFLYST